MVNQVELVGRVLKELDRQGVKDLNTRQMNAVIRAVDSIIDEIEKPTVGSSPGMGFEAWMQSDDTGLSSRYLAISLTGRCAPKLDWPHDADDFGRCVRMLDAVPELRERLGMLEHAPDPWPRLWARWAEAEALYRAGQGKELNDLIREVVNGK
jgi:hypothetical protein